jgi:hypothetical protein
LRLEQQIDAFSLASGSLDEGAHSGYRQDNLNAFPLIFSPQGKKNCALILSLMLDGAIS